MYRVYYLIRGLKSFKTLAQNVYLNFFYNDNEN